MELNREPGGVTYFGSAREMRVAVEKMLDDRGRTHGQFRVGAAKALELQQATTPWEPETSTMMFARQMICVKLARIIVGDPAFEDHWRDIAGYATLVADELAAKKE